MFIKFYNRSHTKVMNTILHKKLVKMLNVVDRNYEFFNLFIIHIINIFFTFIFPIAIGCRRGAVDFLTIFFHHSLFFGLNMASSNTRSVHSAILTCHCILCLPLLLLPSILPWRSILDIVFDLIT